MTEPDEIAHLSVTSIGDLVRAAIRGELDMSNAQAIITRLRHACQDARAVILDLSALRFIDSTAIAALSHLDQSLREAGGTLRITTPSESAVARVLHLSGMDQILSVTDHEDE